MDTRLIEPSSVNIRYPGIRIDQEHKVILGGATPKGDVGYAIGW